MTRRTQADPAITPAPAIGPVIAPVSGSSALDTAPYVGSIDTPVGRPMSGPREADKPRATTTTTEAAEPRTARATLHPALVTPIAPHSTVAERYRGIRTRLTMSEEAGPLRSIPLPNPGPRRRKSITPPNPPPPMAQGVYA